MDVNMPRLNGIEATREVSRQWPEVRVTGLSVHDDSATAEAMLLAGAESFITKSERPEHLLSTVVEAAARSAAGKDRAGDREL